jgi:hypothetical protein
MAAKVLDKDYFYGPLTIAQVTEEAVERNLLTFIFMYEVPFLKLLLGEDFYALYKAGTEAGSPEAKWTALENELYQVSGTLKLSPAANYVYWFYMRNQVTETTGTGEKIISTEGSISVSSAQKVKLAWNNMVTRNRNIVAWIKANIADYPEFVEPVYDSSTSEAIQLYNDRINILTTVIPFI